MAHQINKIKGRLDKVAADGTKFRLVCVDPRLVEQRRQMTYPDVNTSSVIGRENEINEIINLLMQPHPQGDGDGNKSICVIPIVGIGGLGKTTLAKSVFNDKRVDRIFQLKIWVCISDDFDIRKIIIKIINSATASFFTSTSTPSCSLTHKENINNFDIVQLVINLKQKLSGQKFLLVLDDMWNGDRAKWLELKDLIKVGAPGSKIMVTTRSNSIASMMGDVSSYVLEGLSPKDCISLFVKWAFNEGEEKKYPNLVEIGIEIVKKCQGVPLAVRTLGSSLFSNFDTSKWIIVRDSEMWNLEQKKDDILPAHKLSYDQMPSYQSVLFPIFGLGVGNESVLDMCVSRYKYLRYLDLSNSSFVTMPNSISKLEHLRFLDLSFNDQIRTLPNSICKLLQLQVLLLSGGTMLENLPKGLGKLISLRRLIVTTKQSVLPHDKFSSLIHLQTLSFHYCDNIKFLFRQKLPSIEELYFESCGSLESLPLNIFPKLQTLYIIECDKLNLLLNNESPIQTLRMKHLCLVGFSTLVTLPEWIVCAKDTLETLLIMNLPNLKVLPVFLTIMTRLKRLFIFQCPQLLSLSDMRCLTALEHLSINGCPELCRKCQPPIGEYWPMIAHIKTIFIGELTGQEEE